MSDRFKNQVKRSSVWCLILLFMSTLFPATTIFASPESSYSSVIAGGGSHTIGLKKDGTVWTWGFNKFGQLGNRIWTNSSVPVPVYDFSLKEVVAVAGGSFHSIALKKDGTVWTWGYNGSGQLGDKSNRDTSYPVPVWDLSGVVAIAGGDNHSIALKKDGTVWTWGYNGSGQLGDKSTTNSSVPVPVWGLSGVVAIAGGGNHTIALKKIFLKNEGTVWTWGFNLSDQLGNKTTTNSSVPVQVPGKFFVPTPITTLTVSSKTSSSVTMTWPVAANATNVTMEQSSDDGTTWSPSTTGTIAANTSTTTAEGLSPNTAYLFRLVITGGDNAGTSNTVSVTTNAIPTPTPTPPTPTPTPSSADRITLTITLTNGIQQEYDLSMTEFNTFISWYDTKASGTGPVRYTLNNSTSMGPYVSKKTSVIFGYILTFSFDEYIPTP